MKMEIFVSQKREDAASQHNPQIISLHNLKSPSLVENNIGGSWTVASEQARLSSVLGGDMIQHCLTSASTDPEQFVKEAENLNLSAASFNFPFKEMLGRPDRIFTKTHLDRFVDRVLAFARKRDMLYSHMALAGAVNMEVAKELGLPHSFLPHALEIMSTEFFPERTMKPLRLIAEYALAKNATHIITNTEYERAYYAEHYSRLPSDPVNAEIFDKCTDPNTIKDVSILDALVMEKIGGQLPSYDDIFNKCVPNLLGVDAQRYSPERRAELREQFRAAYCEEIGIPSSDDTIIVGSVGRYHPQKDQVTAIKAFKDAYDRLPNELKEKVYMVFVGPDASSVGNQYFAEVEATIQRVCPEISDRIFLNEAESSDKMNAIFDIRLDATRFETFGLATAEALMAGCPTVMASNPVYEELYNGSGLKLIALPDREKVGELGEALERLITSKSDRQSYGQVCHNVARQFSWEDSARRLNNVFKSDLQ